MKRAAVVLVGLLARVSLASMDAAERVARRFGVLGANPLVDAMADEVRAYRRAGRVSYVSRGGDA